MSIEGSVYVNSIFTVDLDYFFIAVKAIPKQPISYG